MKICQAPFILGISKGTVVFFRCFESVEWGETAKLLSVLSTGFCVGLGGKARALWACLILFCFLWGGLQYLKSHNEKLIFAPCCCLLCETIRFVVSSPGFVQYVHCMQINMVKTMSNRLTFEKS